MVHPRPDAVCHSDILYVTYYYIIVPRERRVLILIYRAHPLKTHLSLGSCPVFPEWCSVGHRQK